MTTQPNANAESIVDGHSGQDSTHPEGVVASLVSELEDSRGPAARLDAIMGLTKLGQSALPAIPAVFRAIGDYNELVAYKALWLVSELCPEIFHLPHNRWEGLCSLDRQTRFKAVEELVTLLPQFTSPASSEVGERVAAIMEDPVSQSAKPFSSAVLNEYRGRWIAWDENQVNVLASADTYSQLMDRIADLGLSDPVIEKAPGVHPAVAAKPFTLLDDESPNILDDVWSTIPDPHEWLDTPNERLWCKKPREVIGTEQERQLRYLLRGIRSGISS